MLLVEFKKILFDKNKEALSAFFATDNDNINIDIEYYILFHLFKYL